MRSSGADRGTDSQGSLKMMYEREKGRLTWGVILFSGCVWGEGSYATDGNLGSLNFPLARDRECESLYGFSKK